MIRETSDHHHSDHRGHACRCTELRKQCRATGRAVSREKARVSAEKVKGYAIIDDAGASLKVYRVGTGGHVVLRYI